MRSFTSLTGLVASLLAGSQLAAAHMEMSFPPPFRSKSNPHTTNIDYSMTAPLNADGSNYPCKGYHSDLGTAAGAPTAVFAPGGTYNFTIVGGAAHGGGSCQVSLSYDGGMTFTVIESIIGGCPLSANWDFTIPSDAQPGTAIFAWTWFNQIGNREMYMNCAPVTIGGGSAKREISPRAAAFSARPQIFQANIGNGCSTLESSAVTFPNPGPDVKDNGGAQQPPTGNCGAAAPGGGSGSPGGGSGGVPDTPTTTAAAPTVPATTAPAPPTVEPPKPTNPGIPPRPTSQPTTRPGSQFSSGVFLTISDATTFETTTRTASVAPPAATTTSVKAPATTTVAPVPTTSPGSGSGSGPSTPSTGANSGPCTTEGAWNCIDGTSFQRCASGQWSPVIPMAPGTTCTPGTDDSLIMSGRRSVRRFSA
ncbi:hypothetical protein QBC34DRAFT_490228 [Podospora aff. communis PSN243]|uniref:Uncharacterized protein n=1 Tax=Podospora aff. communis PSN243 TaxID=3040156 RepID=A0AAV9H6K1_9PEZI|nr:hypothetical protein QBC34DRAFT_490228 [Podospora aff. communis PSN243]